RPSCTGKVHHLHSTNYDNDAGDECYYPLNRHCRHDYFFILIHKPFEFLLLLSIHLRIIIKLLSFCVELGRQGRVLQRTEADPEKGDDPDNDESNRWSFDFRTGRIMARTAFSAGFV